ncbi:hypothetical protein HanHA89_Chr15g0603201 [Helianthus annuus]|nr:hypothetical protein HanHA89_Chr15g0603201 [Helianthus annuus]
MNHLFKTNDFSTIFTKKIHAYYDIETTKLHQNEIDQENVIVEFKSTITENRTKGNGSSGGNLYVERRWEVIFLNHLRFCENSLRKADVLTKRVYKRGWLTL